MNFLDEYQKWLKSDIADDNTKKELTSIENNLEEIKERFSKHLEFGTGGLRGIIGAGTNRMNKYVVQRATQGIANYICLHAQQDGKKRGVAIAYDCRHFSDEFAFEAASVLVANGINAFLFESLRPTPELSFAVRHLGCIAGINITASHNPANYNGYKVYWEDGGQIPPIVSDSMLEMINKVEMFSPKVLDKEWVFKSGLLTTIGEDVDSAYLKAVSQQTINKAAEGCSKDYKLVYTPLHGAGNILVRKALKNAGFNNVFVVPEQELPNGAFPTVHSPNPEEKDSFELAISLAKKKEADLIIGTDPDGDRVGVVVRDNNGEYAALSGNQVGALLTHYILTERKANGILPKNAAIISTIVSTKMVDAICKQLDVKLFKTLTGFKFFGELILSFERTNDYQFIFGFEESYGYLAGTHARDKDAVVASMLIAEMAAYYDKTGKTLFNMMGDLYEKYGVFAEKTISITMEGIDGVAKMKNLMCKLRDNPPEGIGDFRVLAIRDYKKGVRYTPKKDELNKLDLATSDVLYFELSDGIDIAVRPSGTEPKIKFYFLAEGQTHKKTNHLLENTINAVNNYLDGFI
ncbi:MAG: phospho-sugar mutase [Firmicutes bacterium]|nr:phospho-sugar mutase [Bacillota bacterium]